MQAADAILEIRQLAAQRRVRFSPHARQRMDERFVRPPDVYSALENATRCTAGDRDRWKVVGPDIDGDELTLAVVIEAGVVVITVF